MRKIFLYLVAVATVGVAVKAYNDANRYKFIDPILVDLVKEFENDMNEAGIFINASNYNITIGGYLEKNLLGIALGMNDDRQVHILLNTMVIQRGKNYTRFVLWHELAHDVFNIKHNGNINLMKPYSSFNDGKNWNKTKADFIAYVKNHFS